jgi:hypothetical protein
VHDHRHGGERQPQRNDPQRRDLREGGERHRSPLETEQGNDTMKSRDKVSGNDYVDAGDGTDTCRIDAGDDVHSCEL